MVGPGRVERPTSRLSGVRSNHLSYEPETLKNGVSGSLRRSIAKPGAPEHALARRKIRAFDGRKGNEDGGRLPEDGIQRTGIGMIHDLHPLLSV